MPTRPLERSERPAMQIETSPQASKKAAAQSAENIASRGLRRVGWQKGGNRPNREVRRRPAHYSAECQQNAIRCRIASYSLRGCPSGCLSRLRRLRNSTGCRNPLHVFAQFNARGQKLLREWFEDWVGGRFKSRHLDIRGRQRRGRGNRNTSIAETRVTAISASILRRIECFVGPANKRFPLFKLLDVR